MEFQDEICKIQKFDKQLNCILINLTTHQLNRSERSNNYLWNAISPSLIYCAYHLFINFFFVMFYYAESKLCLSLFYFFFYWSESMIDL